MRRLFEVLFCVMVLFCSCEQEEKSYPYKQLTYEHFDKIRNTDYALSYRKLTLFIDSLRLSERDTNYIDILTNRYYAQSSPYLWINRWGTDNRVDTLLQWISAAPQGGIAEKTFYLKRINENYKRLKTLNFDKHHTVSRTMATLEYYLTKSYMRYSCGQRFGYVNPEKIYNRFERMEKDSVKSPYRALFSIPIDRPNKKFFNVATQELQQYQLHNFLTQVQPTTTLYKDLFQALQNPNLSPSQRKTITINLERSRWRMKQHFEKRYVMVNLPSQELKAIDKEKQTLSMKVCIGSINHKTPMLTSNISHLELNPYWIIPKSIVKKDIIHHVGDTAYFSRKQFKIVDRETGEFISPLDATSDMLLSHKYIVRQDKGEDNSLGRMIFRFPNSFSIYLHDTNNREAFNRKSRSVSHGCIRLEKPFDLALFLLPQKDDEYIDRIRISLDMQPQTEEGQEMKEKGDFKPLKTCRFTPNVPLLISYYTCYPDEHGQLQYYSDIYQYDSAIWNHLNNSKQ